MKRFVFPVVVVLVAAFPLLAWAFQTRPHTPAPTPVPSSIAAHGAPKAIEPSERGAEEEHALPPINWTDFSNHEQPPWAGMAINLAVLLLIFYKYGKAPISEGLKSRRATIAREIEEATRMKQEAEARAAKYQEKLSHLETELKETRDALKAAGEGERDRLIRDAEEKAARMEKDAKFLVEQELKQLRVELTRDAVETAVLAAEELLKKRITASDQERLAEDYLTQLSSKRPSGQERAAPGSPASQGGE
jgi:F-type H+-transporting ATPase subunit b